MLVNLILNLVVNSSYNYPQDNHSTAETIKIVSQFAHVKVSHLIHYSESEAHRMAPIRNTENQKCRKSKMSNFSMSPFMIFGIFGLLHF